MRILYLHQYFTTREGATGTRSYEMAKALVARGHQVHMVCGTAQVATSGLVGPFIRGQRSGTVDGIDITECAIPYANQDSLIKRSRAFSQYATRCLRIALTTDYDVIFATSTPLTAGIPGVVAKLCRRKPFVFEVRDLWPELPRAMGVVTNPLILGALSLLEWITYRCSDACIGLSPGIVEGIKKRSRQSLPVTFIPNGCDLDLFMGGVGLTAIEHTRTANSKFVAVFTGAHGRANGLQAVLSAAAVLKARGEHHIHLVFIGEGSEKQALIAEAKQRELDNCEFRPLVPKNTLARQLGEFDAGLMILANVPAFYNGTSPNKFFDYIAAGLPIVINYPGWLAEMVNDHAVGIATEPDTADALAEALIALAQDRPQTRLLADNARQLAIRKFDRSSLAQRFAEVIESQAPTPSISQ